MTAPVRPRRRISPELFGRLMAPVVRGRASVRVLSRIVPRTDRLVYRLTRGRATLFSTVQPMLMLVTTGRQSGLPRRIPLLYAEIDGGLAVVGSNWGFAHHPAWTVNLLAAPEATAIIGGVATPVRADLLTGQERETAWSALLRLWPAYRDYAAHAGRELRVFRLAPAGARPGR